MFCPECGHQNPDNAKFCIKCGYNYGQSLNDTFPSSLTKTALPYPDIAIKYPKRKRSTVAMFFLLFWVSVLVFAIYKASATFNLASKSDSSNSYTGNTYSNSASQSSERQAQSQRIINEAFTLSSGEIASYKFTIPESLGTATVVGTFNATGGSDDIYVFIMNETGLRNFKNGNDPKVYYESGRVTTDDIKVSLSPGTYYIVFSNKNSILTPKAVKADISLEY